MFNAKARRSRPDIFVSAKTETAIPARNLLMREALVQASLDPAVRSIGYIPSATAASQTIELGAIYLRSDDGRYHLDVVPARRVRDIDEEGLALIALSALGLSLLVITAEELRREPRYANSRIVWSHNGQFVPIALRMLILQALQDDGPMPLGRLLQSIRSDRDPSAAVMALACADALELDLVSATLDPSTLVRSRA